MPHPLREAADGTDVQVCTNLGALRLPRRAYALLAMTKGVTCRVIAKPVRTLAVAIRPQSLPCLKGGGPAAGWWRDSCGEESPSHGFAVTAPFRQGGHQPLRRFAHLPLHRGRLFIPLLRLPPPICQGIGAVFLLIIGQQLMLPLLAIFADFVL